MVYKVSTSEVATYLTCQRRWMYAHHPSYRLEPRTLGPALTRGNEGHKALELFFKSLMDGNSYQKSEELTTEYLMKRTLKEVSIGDSTKAEILGNLGVLVKDYIDQVENFLKDYNIVGVENEVNAPLPHVNHVMFAGRVDVTLEVPSGAHKGERIPYDHKFSYNFWNEAAITMNAQLPNYVEALRAMGYYARSGIMNMLRYRENAIERFKHEDVPTTSHIRKEFFRDHTKAAVDIVTLKETPDVTKIVTRSSSKFNCEYCPFYSLCNLELRGLDSANKIEASFRPNTYGYDSVLDVE